MTIWQQMDWVLPLRTPFSMGFRARHFGRLPFISHYVFVFRLFCARLKTVFPYRHVIDGGRSVKQLAQGFRTRPASRCALCTRRAGRRQLWLAQRPHANCRRLMGLFGLHHAAKLGLCGGGDFYLSARFFAALSGRA